MPKIPTYDGSSVDIAALQAPTQSSVVTASLLNAGNAGMEDVGKGLAALGTGLMTREKEQKRLRDADMVNRAEMAFAVQQQDFVTEVSKRKGLAAGTAVADTESWAKDRFTEHSKVLENEEQRQAFEVRFADRAIRTRGMASTHAATEAENSYKESRSAQVGQVVGDAAADPALAGQSRAKIDGIISDLAAHNSWDKDVTASKHMEATTMLHTQVIQTLNGRDPAQAEAYFNEHKAEIDGTKHAELKSTYQDSADVVKAQGYVGNLMNQGLSREAAIAKARADNSGKLEDNIVARIEQQFQEKALAKSDREEKLMGPVNKILGDSLRKGSKISPTQADQMLTDLRVSDPEAYNKASKNIYAHNEMIDQDRRQRANAMKESTVGSKGLNWVMLKYDIINNPSKWQNADMIKEFKPLIESGALSPAAVEEAIGMQVALRDPKKMPQIEMLGTADSYLSDKLEGTIFNGKKFSDLKDGEKKVVVANARAAINPLLTNYQTTVGEKANQQDMQSLIDSAFVSKKVRSTFLGVAHGDFKTKLELDVPGAPGRISIVPTAKRAIIINALRKNKEPVTEENIKAYYQAGNK